MRHKINLVLLCLVTIAFYVPLVVGSCVNKPKSDMSNLIIALNSHFIDCKFYPKTLERLTENRDKLSCWRQYMDRIPVDPWEQPYILELGNFPQGFKIISKGKDQILGTKDDISSLDTAEQWQSNYDITCNDTHQDSIRPIVFTLLLCTLFAVIVELIRVNYFKSKN